MVIEEKLGKIRRGEFRQRSLKENKTKKRLKDVIVLFFVSFLPLFSSPLPLLHQGSFICCFFRLKECWFRTNVDPGVCLNMTDSCSSSSSSSLTPSSSSLL